MIENCLMGIQEKWGQTNTFFINALIPLLEVPYYIWPWNEKLYLYTWPECLQRMQNGLCIQAVWSEPSRTAWRISRYLENPENTLIRLHKCISWANIPHTAFFSNLTILKATKQKATWLVSFHCNWRGQKVTCQ